ncbi:DNA-3-methyladenine glycosylase 2 family protein [Chelatococcus reniformis]|uniref:DNA-3-methyladenine glycosylase II n=1 Tax=Chelatococcus reniformis TaxID=1494448 RepID=A0A916TW18_9HYPH|nr:DNA-3-methyladenine glycosylase 2 family protein [Chelatococcus reniformis]GGC44972.1 hypothetical protein GCM10010994_00190 [Chelatococcus reniformis]
MTSLIDSRAALDAGLAALARLDPLMAEVMARGMRPPLRKREPGFRGLAGIIVAQQVSTASANAIWTRLDAALHPTDAHRLLTASDAVLRTAGLSTPKVRALRTIAAAVADGTLPLDALADMDAEAAHATLTRIGGIGPWTADIYLLFCLGHPDTFPAGDLALQEAARLALRLAERPDETAMAALALRWRPWRGAAAYLLWAFYARAKGRDGAPVAGADGATTAIVGPAEAARPPLRGELAGLADGGDAATAALLRDPWAADLLFEGVLSDSAPIRLHAARGLAALASAKPLALTGRAAALIALLDRGTDAAASPHLMGALARAALTDQEARRAVAVLLRIAEGRGAARADTRACALEAAADLAVRTGAHARRLVQVLARLSADGPAALRSRARRLQRHRAKALA